MDTFVKLQKEVRIYKDILNKHNYPEQECISSWKEVIINKSSTFYIENIFVIFVM